MKIITKSHIDAAHAASEYFPFAESEDGRFSLGGPDGYVNIDCASTGLKSNTMSGVGYALYLQYAEAKLGTDPSLTPQLIAEARAFHRAVDDERRKRRNTSAQATEAAPAAERKELENSALSRAVQTGLPAQIKRGFVNCDGSAIECSHDWVVEWIRPDGSKYVTRTHTY